MPIEKVPYVLDLSLLGVIKGVSLIDRPEATPSSPPSSSSSSLLSATTTTTQGQSPSSPPPSSSAPIAAVAVANGIGTGRVLCHYFGGIPYALPPVGPFRFKRPRALAPCYRYGTQANPGRFAGGAGVCPQPGMEDDDEEGGGGGRCDEDCLQLNIWVPAGEPPEGGWPVLFHIHGGFLQWGTPNNGDPSALLSDTAFNAIIVKPAYRLNALGFLAHGPQRRDAKATNPALNLDLDLNLGFRDQRLALEWTYTKISYFGGDAGNITVSGHSAGAHSAFYQLAHELYRAPERKPVIRRVVMWSNGPGLVRLPRAGERRAQFGELCDALGVDCALTPREKLDRFKAVPAMELVRAAGEVEAHEFRAVADGEFVPLDLWERVEDGDFARRMRARGIGLMIGECADEWKFYRTWRPPVLDEGTDGVESLAALRRRLAADYFHPAADALLREHVPVELLRRGKGDLVPGDDTAWEDAFGRAYADAQIHTPLRWLVDRLCRADAPGEHAGQKRQLVFRYRIEWRARCVDAIMPRDWAVTHGSDAAIWWWGNGYGAGLDDEEKQIVKDFALDAFAEFVKGRDISGIWRASGPRQVRTLLANGETVVRDDADWERGLRVWDSVQAAHGGEQPRTTAKL